MMAERGLALSRTTILGWAQRSVSAFEQRWNRDARVTRAFRARRRDLRENPHPVGLPVSQSEGVKSHITPRSVSRPLNVRR
jgi:hypothetical protein